MLMHVLSMLAVLSMTQPLLAVAQLEERPVLDAIPTPPIFQNPFMGANNFSEIHLNAYQTDTTSAKGPASASSQDVQQGLLRPITSIGEQWRLTHAGRSSRSGLARHRRTQARTPRLCC